MNDLEKNERLMNKLKNDEELSSKFSMALYQLTEGNEDRKKEAIEYISKIVKEIQEQEKC